MAYDGAYLGGPFYLGSKGAQSIFFYTTTDAHTDVDGTGYFTDGYKRGMRIGDIVFVNDLDSITAPTAVNSCTMHYVSAVSATTGLATISAAIAGGTVTAVKTNGTAAPTANDDNTAGFALGSIWIDVTNDQAYIAVDVSTGAALWSQIGPRKTTLSFSELSTKAADAAVARFVAPFKFKILKVWSVANGALATGNATLTTAISGGAVTNGVVTITESGSAAGDIDSATPTAANTGAAGALITVTGGGSSTATATANVFVELQEVIP